MVADGLPLFGGARIAVDTTLVSALHCDGSALGGAAHRDGVVLAAARRRKENEVGGRWSSEALVRQLAKKARNETPLMRRRVEQAWKLRWLAILSCAAARTVASSLLELRGHGGADGVVPLSHEVEADFRHAHLE